MPPTWEERKIRLSFGHKGEKSGFWVIMILHVFVRFD